ncbi:putative disease resistance RPP13-like protein 1 [Vigna unguiculata]|uniref:putative disease resistance RPP13-like protein 1 n=1 Tax=Vigna unguiculata TaxID=3917 RepID=UPI001016E835|nr:putative disease resistance RPP13-like protein 1 [Vigna unguiculata]
MVISEVVKPLIAPVCMAIFTFFTRNDVDAAILEELKTQVLCLNSFLGDAEEKQVSNPGVKIWVDELREAVYDADDVMDQLAAKHLIGSTIVLSKVTDYLNCIIEPFDEGMKSKLNRINYRLKSLAHNRSLLGLKEGGGTCLINEAEVYGRDGDRDHVVDTLLSEPTCLPNVIAVVGMAGMGKTTLSQMVYHHSAVKSNFNVRSWVYISDGSNVFEVTKKIYESLTYCNCEIRDLNTLQMKLQLVLHNKKFLLVLDDYWTGGFLDWDLLKRPLESGKHGSCIIVTTRNRSVALTIHAAETYMLPRLEDEACRKLFTHHAFRSKDPEKTPALKDIGEEIVKKCKGHPLSVKALASLLTFNAEVKDWNGVLQSKVLNIPANQSNILHSLMLSYRYLPGHMKQCFAYCSLFPKGHKESKRNCIHLWMAEGLLPESKNEETTEEVGEKYFNEFSSRSILQVENSLFYMYDLMNDLAQYVGGQFFHKMEPNDHQSQNKVRHLSYLLEEFEGVEKFVSIFQLPHLRTFLPFAN